jgi:hypothetical protein
MSQMPDPEAYTGTEPGTKWSGPPPEAGTVFIVRPPRLPPGAVPLYDDDAQTVIGFRTESSGVYRIYDLEGNMVGMDEKGLETPLFDPIDLVLIFGGAFRVLARAGARTAVQVGARASVAGVRALVTTVGEGLALALRATLRRLLAGEIKFTATTAARMATKGRFVPVHILKLAVRYGTRAVDPQGAVGAFEYTIPMVRNGIQYTLKVVLREADNTILHFHYFR